MSHPKDIGGAADSWIQQATSVRQTNPWRTDVASKINGLDSRPVSVGAGRGLARTPDPATGATPNEPATASSGDVHITDTANRLAALEQAVRDLPSVDEARVSQVRSALEDGSYTVHPERIADNLLRMEQSLGQLPDPEQSGQ